MKQWVNKVSYSVSERANIIAKALKVFRNRLENAIDSDSLNDFLNKLGIELDETVNPAYASYNRRTKILVLGALAGKKKDYTICAKRLGIDEQNLEFHDYEEMKTFNTEKLRYSSAYSDIICGPMPHKIAGIGDYTSFITLLKDNPGEYPKVYIATANESIKLSINNFKLGILETRYKEKFS